MTVSDVRREQFKRFNTLYDIADEKIRDEFAYEMCKHYMGDQFRAVRHRSRPTWAGRPVTQYGVAKSANMQQSIVGAFERGQMPNPGLKTILRLAKTLGCAVEIRLIPFSKLIRQNVEYEGLYPDIDVPSYQEETNKLEKLPGNEGNFTR